MQTMFKQLAMPVVYTIVMIGVFAMAIRIGASTRSDIRDILDRYEPTIGTVNSSRVERHAGRGRRSRTTYMPFVEFKYSVDGRVYRSTRYTVGLNGTMKEQDVVALLRPVTPGSEWEVYYDPDRPDDAVFVKPSLDGHWHMHWQYLFLTGAFLVAALVWLGWSILRLKTRLRSMSS